MLSSKEEEKRHVRLRIFLQRNVINNKSLLTDFKYTRISEDDVVSGRD